MHARMRPWRSRRCSSTLTIRCRGGRLRVTGTLSRPLKWRSSRPDCERLRFGHLDLDAVVRRFWTSFDASYPDPNSHPEAPIEELRWREGSNAIRKTLAEYRVACAPDDANCLWEAISNVSPIDRNLHLYPDAAPTVRALDATGYRLALVTARPVSAAIVARELRQPGLPDVFEAIVTSGDVGYRKPHPLVFSLAVLLQLDLLHPG